MTCTTHHDACECRQARVDRTVMLLADALFALLCIAAGKTSQAIGCDEEEEILREMRGYGVVRDEEYGWRVADLRAAALAAKDAEVAAAVARERERIGRFIRRDVSDHRSIGVGCTKRFCNRFSCTDLERLASIIESRPTPGAAS